MTLLKRFFAKVKVSSGCWEWQASKNTHGYGHMRDESGVLRGTHRIAWEMFWGPIPFYVCVCHTCDNPACVNPAHLFLGTNNDNMRDMAIKGRSTPNYMLTEADIPFIRYWLKQGFTQQSIADAFVVSRGAISGINDGRSWSHVQ